jgi:hypothetical protein
MSPERRRKCRRPRPRDEPPQHSAPPDSKRSSRANRRSLRPRDDPRNNPCRRQAVQLPRASGAGGGSAAPPSCAGGPGACAWGTSRSTPPRAWYACAACRSRCRRRSSHSPARWRAHPRACSRRTSCCARSGGFARWAVTVAKHHTSRGARSDASRSACRRCCLGKLALGWLLACSPRFLSTVLARRLSRIYPAPLSPLMLELVTPASG